MTSGRLLLIPNIMKMTNKKFIISIFLLSISAVIIIVVLKSNHHYIVKAIRNKEGWGYDILYKNKIIIHQPYVPGTTGKVTFRYKCSAKKTGHLVVKKLKNKHSPGITRDELINLFKNRTQYINCN